VEGVKFFERLLAEFDRRLHPIKLLKGCALRGECRVGLKEPRICVVHIKSLLGGRAAKKN